MTIDEVANTLATNGFNIEDVILMQKIMSIGLRAAHEKSINNDRDFVLENGTTFQARMAKLENVHNRTYSVEF